jgi:CxxC motif-containing protein
VKQLTCIVCPNGCRISAELRDGRYEFSGNKCPRGADFAKTELTAPVRSVTTTVRTTFNYMPALPVKTNGEIPKALIPALIRALCDVTVTREIGFGETVAEDVLSTGVDVVACGTTVREEIRSVRFAKALVESDSGKEYSHA